MRRLAAPNDFQRVHAIYTHEAVAPYLAYEPMCSDSFHEIYAELLASGAFFVYEERAEVVGFYSITRLQGRAGHVAQIGSLAIDPSMAGRGLGQAMIRDALAELRATNVLRVELLVEADNERAIGFYKKLGFRVEAIMRRAYKRAADTDYTDELLMVRFLD